MNYKEETRQTRKKINDLINNHDFQLRRKFYDVYKTENFLLMEAYCLIKTGPWERLGKAITKVIDSSLKEVIFEDETHITNEFKVNEAIYTSQKMCEGFFDTFEKEIDKKILEYHRKCLSSIESIIYHNEEKNKTSVEEKSKEN